MCLTETLLDDTISDNELHINGYSLLRNDRKRDGGGCAIYIHHSLNFTYIDSLYSEYVESIWCNIKPCSGECILVGCIYRPPSSTLSYYNRLVNNIEKAININHNTVILGDFNIDVSSENHYYYNKFMILCELFDLTQLIKEPTRVTLNTSTIIDLICTTINEKHSDSSVIKITLSDQ